MLIIGICIVVLVFVMFSIEEPEEVEILTNNNTNNLKKDNTNNIESTNTKKLQDIPQPKNLESESSQNLESSEELYKNVSLCNLGDKIDLELRLQINDSLQPINYIKKENAVVVAINIKLNENLFGSENNLTNLLKKIEEILDITYIQFYDQQITKHLLYADRALIFINNPNSDSDPYFEATFSAYLLVTKFKKCLETNPDLRDAGAKISIGISSGEVIVINRGPFITELIKGKPIFIAELLSLSASDFQIFIDETIYNTAQVWFDVREWIPMKLWHTLPAMKFYEILGWNKKDEIYSYINHQNSIVRKAVAIAFKYLEFEDLMPLHHLASDNDEAVALEAIKTLSEIRDERSLAVLKKIVNETKNPVVRSEVIKALGNLKKNELLPIFLGYIKDIHWQVRRNSIYAVFETLGEDAIKHIEQLLSDENGAVKAAALEVYYKITKNPIYLKELKNLLNDLSVRARKSAIIALCSICSTESLSILINSYSEFDFDLQRFTLTQIQGLKIPAEKKWQYYLTLYKVSNEKIRSEIVSLLNNNRSET